MVGICITRIVPKTGPRQQTGRLEFLGIVSKLHQSQLRGGLSKLQVRKTQRWPKGWANFSLLWLYCYWNTWANLHLLGQPNTFLATVMSVR